jgi:hypothetical protein
MIPEIPAQPLCDFLVILEIKAREMLGNIIHKVLEGREKQIVIGHR